MLARHNTPVPIERDMTLDSNIAHSFQNPDDLAQERSRLDLDDIRTYCRMVTAIGITLAIQQELDRAYADMENNGESVEAK